MTPSLARRALLYDENQSDTTFLLRVLDGKKPGRFTPYMLPIKNTDRGKAK
jgi:hypothetical protein